VVKQARTSAHGAGGRWRMPLMAWAAMIVVCLSGWMAMLMQRDGHVAVTANRPNAFESPAPVTDQNLHQAKRVFEEVQSVYEHQAAWVAMTDNDAEVGLASDASPHKRLLLIRLQLMREGKELSSSSLALAKGRYASWTAVMPDGKRLRYHVSTTAESPTQLSLWAESEGSQSAQTIAAFSTTLSTGAGNGTDHTFVLFAGLDELHVTYAQSESSEAAP